MSSLHHAEPHTMIPAERRRRILEILEARRAVRASQLGRELGVSGMTIRRDLEHLESEGLLSRTHGGATFKRHMVGEPFYASSVYAHAEEKRRIAETAATMIHSGETVFLSSGTTAAQVLRHVDPHVQVRVITHNMGALGEAEGSRIELVLLGGNYHAVERGRWFAAGRDRGRLLRGQDDSGSGWSELERGTNDAQPRRGRRGTSDACPYPGRAGDSRRQQQDRRGCRRGHLRT